MEEQPFKFTVVWDEISLYGAAHSSARCCPLTQDPSWDFIMKDWASTELLIATAP